MENIKRQSRAQQLLIAYAYTEGRANELGGSDLAATLFTDLLADFMHLAAALGLNLQSCIDVAQMHFEAEVIAEALDENPVQEHLGALRRIAGIPLWGEPIADPAYGDKNELAEHGEYDLENDHYEPCIDAESEWLTYAVEVARRAITKKGETL